ncbi:MAG: hypothetical protein ACYDCC_16370 [Actinomycetota bacterium]
MNRKVLAPVVALAIIAALVPQGSQARPRAGRGPAGVMTFGPATIVDPVNLFGEPDIRVAPDGSTYVSGPWGTGTQRSIWEVSSDGGHTYRTMHDRAINTPAESATTIVGPGGGDTEIAIDHTSKVYYMDLAALASMKVATWNPSTRTMNTNTFVKGKDNVSGYDRQWFALWDPPNPEAVRKATGYTGPFPVNYLTYLEALGSLDCTTVSQAPLPLPANPPVQLPDVPTVSSPGCESTDYTTDGVNYSDVTASFVLNGDGPTTIDQQTGTVLQAVVPNGNDVGVSILTRDSSSPSDPALRHSKVVSAAKLPNGQSAGCLFPVISMDSARTAYLAWVTCGSKPESADPSAWQAYYSYATARSGWTHWSKPIRVSRPPSLTATMPWIVAGAKGRIAIAWYGTNDGIHDPSSQDAHQAWDVFLATLTHADSAHPTITQQKVTRHPMHYGTICMRGLGCIAVQGNRNLADFFEMTIDPHDGSLSIVYDDTSNELSQNAPTQSDQLPQPIDGTTHHRGAAVVTVMKQNGGPTLLGGNLTAPRARVSNSLFYRGQDFAKFDPVYGSNSIPEMTLRRLTASRRGDNYVFRIGVDSLANPQNALSATNSTAVDYVVRWVGPQTLTQFGLRNPIYYAAVEVGRAGAPTYFAGAARSVDLCSVSACDPHGIEYPAPPYGGVAVSGNLVTSSDIGDYFEITVPASAVGSPAPGSLIESVGAYAFARSRPASTGYTNAELQAGVAPVEVNGLCCLDLKP